MMIHQRADRGKSLREHGTHARYRSGCRCFHCRVAASDYERERRAGIRRTLDAEPVRAHILALVEAGMSRRGIAKAAGLSCNTVAELVSNKTRRCNKNTADRILGVTTRDRHEGHLYPSEIIEPMIEAIIDSNIPHTHITTILNIKSH